MTQAHAVGDQSTPDERFDRLYALMWALQGHRFEAVLTDDHDALKVSHPDRPDDVFEVRCAPRASDGGRLWYVSGERPVAEADNMAFALTGIQALTTPRM